MRGARWVDLGADDPSFESRRAGIEELARRAGTDFPGVLVHTRLSRGAADRCLIDTARGAELTVVGRHGRTPLDHAGLGTVSTPVVEHADGVVLVVPVTGNAS